MTSRAQASQRVARSGALCRFSGLATCLILLSCTSAERSTEPAITSEQPRPPAPPALIEFAAQPTLAASGTRFFPPVQVALRLGDGRMAAQFNGTVSLSLGANEAGASLVGDSTASAVAGVATFPNLGVSEPGKGFTLRARALELSVPSLPFEIARRSVSGQIAFVRSVGEKTQIYLMDADGSHAVRLTDALADQRQPAWSPDGSQLAFASFSQHGPITGVIYVMNADGSGLVRLTDASGWVSEPAWSPDGSKIAFVSSTNSGSGIGVMNRDGSGARLITSIQEGVLDLLPDWSPDGAQLAFIRGLEGASPFMVYTMRADGSAQTRLFPNNGYTDEFGPSWSPVGGRFLYRASLSSDGSLALVNADGSGPTADLQPGVELAYTRPSWSPEGGRIAFASGNRFDSHDIFVVNLDGSGRKQLTTGGVSNEPVWRPGR